MKSVNGASYVLRIRKGIKGGGKAKVKTRR